jgi:hypothetical protein
MPKLLAVIKNANDAIQANQTCVFRGKLLHCATGCLMAKHPNIRLSLEVCRVEVMD